MAHDVFISYAHQDKAVADAACAVLERAVAAGLPVLPVRIEDVPMSKALEYFISTPHWLDALSPPLEAHLDRLAGTVRVILGERAPDRMPPAPGRATPVPGAGSRRRAGLVAGVVVAATLLGLAGGRLLAGGGNLDRRLVGDWSFSTRDARGTWTGTLKIDGSGRFESEIGVEDAGTIRSGGGR